MGSGACKLEEAGRFADPRKRHQPQPDRRITNSDKLKSFLVSSEQELYSKTPQDPDMAKLNFRSFYEVSCHRTSSVAGGCAVAGG